MSRFAIRFRLSWVLALSAFAMGESVSVAQAQVGPESRLLISVDAGPYVRQDTPVEVSLPTELFRKNVGRADAPAWRLRALEAGEPAGPPIPVEIDPIDPNRPDAPVHLTWVLPGTLDAGQRRTYRLEESRENARPWSLTEGDEGTLDLGNRERTVFRYHLRPSSHPNFPPIQRRDAYIHPAFTPSGFLVTGDFSKAHPHHRGFFLAYTKTQVGSLHPDFWNIQGGSGKIYCDHLGKTSVGPVTARFTTHHRWEASGKVVLRERWDVQAYDIPGQPYWLFDLTTTQQATDEPMEVLPYRYGGMAYRGPDSFLPSGVLNVLTSAGLDRRRGDQKPARWVDLTGPITEGSDQYAGAMIADHPANIHHPTVARIHPTSLPFFCYVPGHDEKVTIGTTEPTVFRYRILIHDGHPDRERDERIWRDFAEPPVVTVGQRTD